MAGRYGPNTVTDNLVLHLDAANVESYAPAGTIPQKSESIAGGFIDDSSPPAHTSYYTILGDDGLYINSTAPINDWLGSFQSTVATTGYYTVVFEHQADDGSSSFKIQNNGVNAGAYTATITTTTAKQIHTETNNITSTGASTMYIARSGGTGNITITNFRLYKSDSAGNSVVWNDLSSNDNNATIGTAVTFSSTNAGGLTTLNEQANSNTAINGTFSLNSLHFTWEIWFTDAGGTNIGNDSTGFCVKDSSGVGSGSSNSFRYRINISQFWTDGTYGALGGGITAYNTPTQIVVQRSGLYAYVYRNGSVDPTASGALSGSLDNGTFVDYSMNDISKSSSGYGWNGT